MGKTSVITPSTTWETEIIVTLHSPLTGLIIAGNRYAQGLLSITIHPWMMINDPVGRNSERPHSNCSHKLIRYQTQKHTRQTFPRPCSGLEKVDKNKFCVGACMLESTWRACVCFDAFLHMHIWGCKVIILCAVITIMSPGIDKLPWVWTSIMLMCPFPKSALPFFFFLMTTLRDKISAGNQSHLNL